ncbi:hypothetical protein K438DRAFT_1992663 [Mycena galopus ATCC 62051]|nr:hypothetical protein K438DRAFT_1992663 [Mycena galopus ATCC 62051]
MLPFPAPVDVSAPYSSNTLPGELDYVVTYRRAVVSLVTLSNMNRLSNHFVPSLPSSLHDIPNIELSEFLHPLLSISWTIFIPRKRLKISDPELGPPPSAPPPTPAPSLDGAAPPRGIVPTFAPDRTTPPAPTPTLSTSEPHAPHTRTRRARTRTTLASPLTAASSGVPYAYDLPPHTHTSYSRLDPSPWLWTLPAESDSDSDTPRRSARLHRVRRTR